MAGGKAHAWTDCNTSEDTAEVGAMNFTLGAEDR